MRNAVQPVIKTLYESKFLTKLVIYIIPVYPCAPERTNYSGTGGGGGAEACVIVCLKHAFLCLVVGISSL